MPYDAQRHHRQTVRLRGYDYAEAGAYFVPLVSQDRACLFGDVVDGKMCLSAAGLVIASWWGNLEQRFPTVATDEFVVMPNHVHGVVFLGANVPDDVGNHRDIVAAEAGDHTGSPLPADVVGMFLIIFPPTWVVGDVRSNAV